MYYYKIEFIAPDGVIETSYYASQQSDKTKIAKIYNKEFKNWARERWWLCYDNYYADDIDGFIKNCHMEIASIALSVYIKNA